MASKDNLRAGSVRLPMVQGDGWFDSDHRPFALRVEYPLTAEEMVAALYDVVEPQDMASDEDLCGSVAVTLACEGLPGLSGRVRKIQLQEQLGTVESAAFLGQCRGRVSALKRPPPRPDDSARNYTEQEPEPNSAATTSSPASAQACRQPSTIWPEPGTRDVIVVVANILGMNGSHPSAPQTRKQALSDADHLAILNAMWQGELASTTTAIASLCLPNSRASTPPMACRRRRREVIAFIAASVCRERMFGVHEQSDSPAQPPIAF